MHMYNVAIPISGIDENQYYVLYNIINYTLIYCANIDNE